MRLAHLRQGLLRCAEEPQGQRRKTAHGHTEVETMVYDQGVVGGRDLQGVPMQEVWAFRGPLSTKEQRCSERRVCRQEEDRVTVLLGYGEQMRRQFLRHLQLRPL